MFEQDEARILPDRLAHRRRALAALEPSSLIRQIQPRMGLGLDRLDLGDEQVGGGLVGGHADRDQRLALRRPASAAAIRVGVVRPPRGGARPDARRAPTRSRPRRCGSQAPAAARGARRAGPEPSVVHQRAEAAVGVDDPDRLIRGDPSTVSSALARPDPLRRAMRPPRKTALPAPTPIGLAPGVSSAARLLAPDAAAPGPAAELALDPFARRLRRWTGESVACGRGDG